MISYNLHQHSLFSDGKAEPEAYIRQALSIGFEAIGFSEHSPLPFETTFSLKENNLQPYVDETERLKQKYEEQLIIYRALEMDFIPGLSDNFDLWRSKLQLDYLIGSVHLVKPENGDELWFIDGPKSEVYDQGLQQLFGGDIRKAVKTYYHQINRMLESQQFEIVGHVDKIKMHNKNRFFSESESWYQQLVAETIDLIRQTDLVVEVNTRGMYKKRAESLFPDDVTLKMLNTFDIPVLISSDAHHPSELNLLFDYAEKRLLSFGFGAVAFYDHGEWHERPLR